MVSSLRPRPVDATMATERAASFTKRSIKDASKRKLLLTALSMLDLTTLEGKDSPDKVRGLCAKAMRPYERDERVLGQRLPSVGAVCVYPNLIPTCVEMLRPPAAESSVKIAAVATGFPSGQFPLDVRLEDVRQAVAMGADEIDMVISRGLFLAGQHDKLWEEVRETKKACKRADGSFAHLKVILETGELETFDNVRLASDISIRAMHEVCPSGPADAHGNIDFIKTSTGKVQPAATMPVTLVMLEAIRDWYLESGHIVGMKPAGGIRTAKQAVHYLVMVHEVMGPLNVPGFAAVAGNPWMTNNYFRFGASTLCNDILRQLVKLKTGKYVAGYDFAEA
jgi:deoxyribose-phosphate aldolase